jgi:hypothetical protein
MAILGLAFSFDIYPTENGACVPFINTHILRNECFKMENDLASSLAPVFVESCPFDDLRLQLVVRLRNELPRQCFNDGSRVDAMREEVIELSADLEETCGAAFLDNLVCDLGDESFPVRRWNVRKLCDVLAAVSVSTDLWCDVEEGRETYFCACTASNINNALLKFLPLSFAILLFSTSTSFHPSFAPTFLNTSQISISVGAATLTSNVLLLIGAIILLVEFASRINLRFGEYFSIVLLSAACASRVRWSASLITTTLNFCRADWSTCCV